ncbi:sarcosine oxidase subunit gamma family protein [Ruegeria sp. HKCCD8929]|uniref:sarcosine oxidase subunit gamma n=1 Tax=Ruegeria sp. HKCCD8929 TaxID=2683006 RepID=UPI0014884E41
MDKLSANTPCEGLLPLTVGSVNLTEEDPGAMTSIAPYKGRVKDLSAALKAAHGMTYPAANRATGKAGARAVWFGHAQAMLMGPAPDASLAEHAALVDQSDAWAVVRLEGDGVEDVLARLVPVDLRPAQFKRGHTVRSLLFHMSASITKVGEKTFQIMVFRSMAETLVHDLKTAMEGVAARG